MTNFEPKLLTIPVISLLVFIICTLYPLIYSYLPILGKIKAVMIAGLVMLVSYIFTTNNYGNVDAYRNALFVALVGFLSAVVLSLFVSLDRGGSFDLLVVNIKYFLVIAIMIKIIDNSKRFDLLLGVFAACGVGMAFKGVLNYVTGQTNSHSGYTSSSAISIGVFGDPNDLALLFNTTLPFVLYFWVKAEKKLLPLLCVLLIVMAIIFTFSRGGFLGLCTVGLGFYIFHARRQKKYLVYLLIFVALFGFLSPPEYTERLSSILGWDVDQETGETGTRMDAWRMVFIETITKHPVLGVGAGSSIYISGHAKSDWHLIHNAYLQVFSELGLVGMFFYMRFFYLPYKQFRAAVRHKGTGEDYNLLRYSMLIISFMSYGLTVIFLPQAYSPILYLLVGIAIIQAQLTPSSARTAQSLTASPNNMQPAPLAKCENI